MNKTEPFQFTPDGAADQSTVTGDVRAGLAIQFHARHDSDEPSGRQAVPAGSWDQAVHWKPEIWTVTPKIRHLHDTGAKLWLPGFYGMPSGQNCSRTRWLNIAVFGTVSIL